MRSAKAATTTIPIVFTTASDPVEAGIVASLNQPGGKVTGATFLGSLVATKQVGLLRDLLPKLATVGLLTAVRADVSIDQAEVLTVAQTSGLRAVVVDLNSEHEIDTVFSQLAEQRVDALVIASGVFFVRQRDRLIALAAKHALPSIYTDRLAAAAAA